MAAIYSATGFSNVLVKLVTAKKVAEACFGDGSHAYLGMITKKQDVAGAGTTVPIHYAPNRYSGTFTTAQTNANGHKYGGWTLSGDVMIPHYGIVEIDTLTKELMSKDEASFLSMADLKSKAALQAIGNGLSAGLFGSGTGVIGTSASATGSSGAVTITLSVAQQAYNFEVGQYIETDSHLYGTADSYGYITAVDPIAGTIGYTVTSGTLGSTDYIWNQGNEPTASGYAYYKAVSGMEGWVPSATPASTAWFGQDRSGHPRLGGLHLTGTSYTVKEAVMRGLTMCTTGGARGPFAVICHPDQWNVLAMALEGASSISKVYPTGFDGKAIEGAVGFSAINFVSPGGDAQVIADKDCLPTVIYVGPKDNAELHFTPSGIHLIDGDIPVYNSDARQYRFGCFANLVVPVPGHWCRILVNAP